MAEKSGFFNAEQMENGDYDREYDAEQFAEYFANFISNGVYANPANQLKVVFENSPSKPLTVVVRKGKAYIDGYWYELTEDMELTVSANTSAYEIKDVVCCTLDKTERKVSIILKEDVISDTPVKNNVQHDLVLSTILVQPNVSKLNAEDITDKRPDKTYCGFVTGLIDQIDTTELFQQYDDAFQEWFNEMKDQLTEDAAGNLQQQIDALENKDNNLQQQIDALENEDNNLQQQIDKLKGSSYKPISSNDSEYRYKIGGSTYVVGSKTIQANGDYVLLFTLDQLRKIFGNNFNSTRFSIATVNGDSASAQVHYYAPEVWSDGSVYQYFYPSRTGAVRINYRMEHRPA